MNRSRIAVCIFETMADLTTIVARLVATGTAVTHMAVLVGPGHAESARRDIPELDLCIISLAEPDWADVRTALPAVLDGMQLPEWLGVDVREGGFALLVHDIAPRTGAVAHIVLTSAAVRMEFHDVPVADPPIREL